MAKAKKSKHKKHGKSDLIQVSSPGDFKNKTGGLLDLPSGLRVEVRNPGSIKTFFGSDVIPNSLLPIMQEALKKGKKVDPAKFLDESKGFDPEMMQDLSDMMDNITVNVVVNPPIEPALTQADVDEYNAENEDDPAESIEDLRDDMTLYVDELPLDDKQFIFQWVTSGNKDLEKFRREREDSLGVVAEVTGNVSKAQQRAGIRPE